MFGQIMFNICIIVEISIFCIIKVPKKFGENTFYKFSSMFPIMNKNLIFGAISNPRLLPRLSVLKLAKLIEDD